MAVAESSHFLSHPVRTHTWFRNLSLLTVLAAFALVIIGGVVRVTGSGLGCPDWPLCYGRVVPPLQLDAILEYTHRAVASFLVGPLILATCGAAWLAYRRERWLVIPATLAVIMLIGQALLGGITVLNELPGAVVATHLALAEILLACLILIAIVAYRGPLTRPGNGVRGHRSGGRPDRFPALVLASTVGVYILILSGAIVTAAGATAACLGWPLCGTSIGDGQLQAIHMGHRYFAAIIGLLLMYTLHLGFRDKARPPDIRFFSLAAAALFIAQAAVGATTVLLGFPIAFMALHLAMATAVWGATVALAILSFTRQPHPSKEPTYA